MKKILSMLLVFAMMFGLIACGASKPAETQAPTEAPAPATTAAPTEAATEVPTQAGLVVDTCILKEADDKMLNTYTVIAVNPEAPFVDADGNSVADVTVNTAGADAYSLGVVIGPARTVRSQLHRTTGRSASRMRSAISAMPRTVLGAHPSALLLTAKKLSCPERAALTSSEAIKARVAGSAA